jgi:hypothetical protein
MNLILGEKGTYVSIIPMDEAFDFTSEFSGSF